jgi:hypothetical protein
MPKTAVRSHSDLDARSLARHRLVAVKIRQEPLLFERVKEMLARWQRQASAASAAGLRDWQKLLDLGMEQALTVALEESERGNAFRQNSPFCGILTRSERRAFYRHWRHDPRAT